MTTWWSAYKIALAESVRQWRLSLCIRMLRAMIKVAPKPEKYHMAAAVLKALGPKEAEK